MQSTREGANGTIPPASGRPGTVPVETPNEGEDGASATKNDGEAAAPHPVRSGINGFRSRIEVDGLKSSTEFFFDLSYGESSSAGSRELPVVSVFTHLNFAERS